MGASRWRLVRYHLSEALVMALLGGASRVGAALRRTRSSRRWAFDIVGTGARAVHGPIRGWRSSASRCAS